MKLVAAPDSFKGSVSAAQAAAALAAGWLSVRPGDEVVELPLADGGEGTLEVLAATRRRSWWHTARVSGPGDRQVTARWLEFERSVHVVELASAAGLTQLEVLAPLRAHSYGVGELIGRAMDAGAREVVLTLGGSACTDGGSGALAALGARFLDRAGRDLARGGGPLAELASIDLTGLRQPPPGGIRCLTDVTSPLLGPSGAAAVFGPQKGATRSDIDVLEAGLTRLAELLGGEPAAPGAGAAGGTAYGMAAAWGAEIAPGAPEIARIAGLEQALDRAELVITGEGQYDQTSLAGKVVGTVCAVAQAASVRVAVVAGGATVAPPLGAHLVELTQLAGSEATAMADAPHWLREAGRILAEAAHSS
jgi:glycerate 2-kinase